MSDTLRVTLPVSSVSGFVLHHGRMVTTGGVFLPTSRLVPVGSRVRFRVELASGAPLLQGEGVVRWARGAATPPDPSWPAGLGVRFGDLDAESREVLGVVTSVWGPAAHSDEPPARDFTAESAAVEGPAPVGRAGPAGPPRPPTIAPVVAGGPRRTPVPVRTTPPPVLGRVDAEASAGLEEIVLLDESRGIGVAPPTLVEAPVPPALRKKGSATRRAEDGAITAEFEIPQSIIDLAMTVTTTAGAAPAAPPTRPMTVAPTPPPRFGTPEDLCAAPPVSRTEAASPPPAPAAAPSASQALSLPAALRARKEDPAQAEVELQRAIADAPTDALLRFELGRVYLGWTGRDGADHDGAAEAAFARAVELDPDFEEAHVALGQVRLRRRLVREAEATFRQALARWPRSHGAREGLALTSALRWRSRAWRGAFGTAALLLVGLNAWVLAGREPPAADPMTQATAAPADAASTHERGTAVAPAAGLGGAAAGGVAARPATAPAAGTEAAPVAGAAAHPTGTAPAAGAGAAATVPAVAAVPVPHGGASATPSPGTAEPATRTTVPAVATASVPARETQPASARASRVRSVRSTASATTEPAAVKSAPAASKGSGVAAALVKAGDAALRGGRPEEALASFQKALQADPRHAPALRGLGSVYLMQGDDAKAAESYRRYLQMAPNAADAARIQALVAGL